MNKIIRKGIKMPKNKLSKLNKLSELIKLQNKIQNILYELMIDINPNELKPPKKLPTNYKDIDNVADASKKVSDYKKYNHSSILGVVPDDKKKTPQTPEINNFSRIITKQDLIPSAVMTQRSKQSLQAHKKLKDDFAAAQEKYRQDQIKNTIPSASQEEKKKFLSNYERLKNHTKNKFNKNQLDSEASEDPKYSANNIPDHLTNHPLAYYDKAKEMQSDIEYTKKAYAERDRGKTLKQMYPLTHIFRKREFPDEENFRNKDIPLLNKQIDFLHKTAEEKSEALNKRINKEKGPKSYEEQLLKNTEPNKEELEKNTREGIIDPYNIEKNPKIKV